MSRDDATLLDIYRAAQLSVEFRDSLDQESFNADIKTQSAVLHQLLVLGEAVKRLSNQYREDNPQIPWRLIAGMRDNLIHGYDVVDLEEVWNTINRDIPNLIQLLEPLVPSP
jgi:uncharacterized protein with HEPN domain